MHAERVPWSNEAEAGLAEAIDPHRDGIASDVIEGRAELWKLDNGQSWMITRGEGAELVIVAFQGANLRAWMRRLYVIAKSLGYKTARFHVLNPAVARLCPYPIDEVERVYRVRLSDE